MIYQVNTSQGPLYMSKGDHTRLQAYIKVLNEYERNLVKKYGKQFNLLITPAEYQKAIFLHNRVNSLVQKIKAEQTILKRKFNR